MTIPAATLRAYRRSTYTADEAVVRIGQRSASMDALLRRHCASTGAFITAWNPFSRRMPDGWNQRRQQALAERLRRFTSLPAYGQWRRWGEAHLLVLGDPRPVRRLALVFRQSAIVIVRAGRRAQLIVLL